MCRFVPQSNATKHRRQRYSTLLRRVNVISRNRLERSSFRVECIIIKSVVYFKLLQLQTRLIGKQFIPHRHSASLRLLNSVLRNRLGIEKEFLTSVHDNKISCMFVGVGCCKHQCGLYKLNNLESSLIRIEGGNSRYGTSV